MKKAELKHFLDEKVDQYNSPKFITSDPIQIPHLFSKKQDIEIAGYFAATLAWGQRKTIIRNANLIITLMDNAPYDFILNHSEQERLKFKDFKHRTFNGEDAMFFLERLQHLYKKYNSMENVFAANILEKDIDMSNGIDGFRKEILGIEKTRTSKHISSPKKGSATKRIVMFLRWMVRQDNKGVDFGIWKDISPSLLSCPLDVHSGNVARKLNLLKRSQNDWKAVKELDCSLRLMDSEDPAKYDFALFGLGVFEGF